LPLKRKWKWQYGVHVIENQSLGMLETRFFDKKGVQQKLAADDNKTAEKQ
jgi:hypothetical protein